jgi:hypothetical protein
MAFKTVRKILSETRHIRDSESIKARSPKIPLNAVRKLWRRRRRFRNVSGAVFRRRLL